MVKDVRNMTFRILQLVQLSLVNSSVELLPGKVVAM